MKALKRLVLKTTCTQLTQLFLQKKKKILYKSLRGNGLELSISLTHKPPMIRLNRNQ